MEFGHVDKHRVQSRATRALVCDGAGAGTMKG